MTEKFKDFKTPRAYLLDIEGTTTPVDFVHKTLFPFARAELNSFLARSISDPLLQEDVFLLREEYASETDAPEWDGSLSTVDAYLRWLMDQDRKSRGLKSIQGRIWEEGYRTGKLLGEVYPDVPVAMRRWKSSGASIYIYSSGSVLAQKLIFGHLPDRPLTPLIDGYFDTEVGPKRFSASYATIASRIGDAAAEILFLSDIAEEVSAAKEADMCALQVLRDSHAPGEHEFIRSFEELP